MQMMFEYNYDVKVDKAAYDKMFRHIRFLAQISVSAAEYLYDDMKKAIDDLKINPQICSVYIQRNPNDIELRYKLCGKRRYKIVFEIIGNTVYVYDIQDCRQNTDKSLVD